MKYVIIILACIAIAASAFAKNEHKEKKQKSLPPGLVKKVERGGELPPGWQKKIIKGEVLDSELYDIAGKIPNRPSKTYPSTKDSELLQLEKKIIRVENDTKEILEIIDIDTGS